MKWARQFRKRSPADGPRERVDWPGLLFVVLVLAGFAFLYACPRLTRTPLARRDFDGRVVEKFVALGESQVGSATLPRLVVETDSGARFNVAVSDEQYERARVGMWVSRHGGELTLSWHKPEPGTPGGGGARMEAR